MTMQTELDNFRAAWESRVGEDIARLIGGDIENLRNSGILDRTARAGDALPSNTPLLDQHGAAFDLDALVAQQPVIITYYRGGWCPYCNLELRAFQAALPAIKAAGAALVAVTFEQPDHSLNTAQKNDLDFTVVTDVNGALASALGIRFTLSDAVRPFYEKAGHALPERNATGDWALPMPATFVVERGGRIRAAFIEPDYRKRTDPRAALDALAPVAA